MGTMQQIQHLDFKIPARIFRILGNPSGLKIFALLGGVGEMCVSDIAKRVELSLSATSHQLQKMEAAGILNSIRDGRTICYNFRNNGLNRKLFRCLKQLLGRKGRMKQESAL